MLELVNAGLKLGKRNLVQGVSLSVQPGELLAVCGPNGAGKSSLMRLMSGEVQPSTGNASWNGIELTQWNPLALARQRALLQQRNEVGFDYTAMEVILLGRHPHHQGASRQEDMQIAAAALAEVNALPLARQLYSTLSGGEQARVQMARVLAQIWESCTTPTAMPRLLLLDEPTAALDPRQQQRLLSIARQWANKGDVAVVAIVHDLNLAALYADRIALLKQGELYAIDRVARVLSSQMVEACFDLPCLLLDHPDGGPQVMVARRGVLSQLKISKIN